MIAATRRWLKRNRTNFAIGFGVLGAGYVAGQYIFSKISETRERMNSDRVAKENLRRRFQQNQEDCTFTVLALLPTATENILDALPVESITNELQQQRAEKLGRSAATSELAPSELSSGARSGMTEDVKSQGSMQTDDFLHTSQMASSNVTAEEPFKPKKTKAQLWDELKISSITRSFTLLYTLSFLTLLTRIQLNLLGRRNYLSSVVSLASPPRKDSTISLENHEDDKSENWGTDFDTNRKYLTYSWWLLHRGWRAIMDEVETAVQDVFGPIKPREDISLEKLSELVVEVRKKIEGERQEDRRNRKWLSYLLPPREEEEFVLQESGVLVDTQSTASARNSPPGTDSSNPAASQPTLFSQVPPIANDPLRRLLDESADLIESPTATHIMTLLLDTIFSQLTDVALRGQAFKVPDTAQDPSLRIQEISDPGTHDLSLEPEKARAKLATILAVVTRQAHVIGNGVPNAYVQAMENVRELEAFAAVVYSSNFELDSIPQAGASAEQLDISEEAAQTTAEENTPSRGIAATTYGVFEGVWGRVVGGGGKGA